MKKMFFTAAAVLLIAAGCGKQAATSGQTANNQPAQVYQKSLKDLLAGGNTLKCTVSYFDIQGNTNVSVNGTIYIDNGKLRGDYTTVNSGTTNRSHVITQDQIAYTWVEGMSNGYKMPLGQTSRQNINHPGDASPDMNKQMNYSCAGWTADNSMFAVPANLNFTDVSAMGSANANTAARGGAAASNNAAMCAACNNAGAGKAQCLATLGCK